jgi:predicted metal-binding membrane protein
MSPGLEYNQAMAAMGMAVSTSWTVVDLLFAFTMWAVMMVGMMAPSATPVLVLFAAAQRGRGAPGASWAVLIFALGHVAVWTAFSAAATGLQWLLQHMSLLSPMLATSRSQLGAAILIAAGAYQLTPWKNRCLSHCRSPLGFLMTSWRDGKLGSLKMGLHHGVYCLGCCWALMCVLFVVGVMNLIWVAALTLFIFVEKVGPAGASIARVAGAGMILFGVVEIVMS